MKTINTILPIYDSLEKQDRNRTGSQMPILTPRYRLPAFQWKDETDGAATVSTIELIGESGEVKSIEMGFCGWTNSSDPTVYLESSGLNVIRAYKVSGTSHIKTYIPPEVNGADVILIKLTLNDKIGHGIKLVCYENTTTETITYDLVEGENIIRHTITFSGPLLLDIYSSVSGITDYSLYNVEIGFAYLNRAFHTYLPQAQHLSTDVYFRHFGDTLNYLLPFGSYYLKMIMNNGAAYYSDWFTVTDINEDKIDYLTNLSYSTGIICDNRILLADTSTDGIIEFGVFDVKIGESITCVFSLSNILEGEKPLLQMKSLTGVIIGSVYLDIGRNLNTFTSTVTGGTLFRITNTTTSSWASSEILIIRNYSPGFMKIAFTDSHDLGDILYDGGFTNTCFLEAKLNNPTHEVTEVGEEKNGIFITEKIVTKYKYKIIANVSRLLYTALMRLPQHDTITITDEVGNVYMPKVGNIWVSAPNWIFYDVCRIEIQFNDNSEFVWTSENNNLT